MIGQTLGHYRVIEKIGAGGMGVVYRARDERLERDVALKVLPAGALADEETRMRFRREALALSKLNHPNIATVHDFNTESGVDFLAMEYISGVTLREKTLSGALPEAEVVSLGKQAAEALEAAHEQGIIHRDLKPGNIMVTPKGLLKVLDFGLAKLFQPSGAIGRTLTVTGSQGLTGTLPYMAPEQLDGREVDARTDIYALGAIFHELVTGKKPFPQETPSEIMHAILDKQPELPRSLGAQISEGLERIILKCLEKEPANRYASAKELIADLNQVETGDLSALIAGKPRRRAKRSLWQKPLPISVLVLGVAGLLFALNIGGIRDFLTGRARTPQVQSLAVLPLENLSGDPAQDYFAEGITDALINELGQISTLQVKSRTSVMQYKKTEKSLPQIAKELNADMVVEGSVLRAGEKVRITAKLVHPAEDRQLWVKSYDRDIGDFLVLQSEIAQDITRQIGIRLREEKSFRSAKRKTVNPQALDAYLKGVYSGDNGYFNQAIKLDPDFALAYTEIAKSYFYSGLLGDVPPREAFLEMKQAALKALEKDNTLGEAHGYLAVAWLHYDLNWAEAEKEFKRALELNPSLAMIHHLYAHLLMALDRTEESMAEVKLASGLDPFANPNHLCSGWHCFSTAGYDEAIELARKDILAGSDVSWAHVTLGMAYEQKFLIKEAIVEFQNAVDNWKGNFLPLAGLGHAYGIAGKKKEAQEILEKLLEEKLLEKSKRIYVSAYDIAAVYIGLGEKNQAFEWLSKALEERSGFLVYIKCDRRFDVLRSDPRYEALLKRIGLPLGAIKS
ncbi:MAG: protein kinase [Candidatus Aminicenantes bacterium]|nr:protein kinase [Candidatus Aminicenantes bacterium]